MTHKRSCKDKRSHASIPRVPET